ncbi:MAG: hypothetical protein BMS9Abin32_050 [Gammaproteobacteria bacterium]|nr:MAG: hypothetical protein BMS9Abin32_050 [Gammaproteobacteria bacterium]
MRLPSLVPQNRNLQRLMQGHATEMEIDAHGRILLTQPLRKFAGLGRDAILLGQGNKFELWDEAKWDETCDSWLADEGQAELSAALESLCL